MRYRPSELIEVRQAGKKGRGVFARKSIRKGRVIERAPVVVMQVREIFGAGPRTTLTEYVFSWGRGKVAFACGYGALYNHSYQPNAAYYAARRAGAGLRGPARHQGGRGDHRELQRRPGPAQESCLYAVQPD